MSERNWGEADSTPTPKKKGIPTWLWFCGGGCLLALVLAIVAGYFLVSKVAESANPEKQWPKVAELLPFDERPPELTLLFGINFGMGVYTFTDSRGYMAVLMHMPMGGAKDREKLMNPDSDMGFMGKRKDARASKLKVQGRELDVLHFQHMGGGSGGAEAGQPKIDKGPAVMIDLTKSDQSGFLIFQLVRVHSDEPIGDDEIISFLKPFHVGPVR
jgi:hypothetical protein